MISVEWRGCYLSSNSEVFSASSFNRAIGKVVVYVYVRCLCVPESPPHIVLIRHPPPQSLVRRHAPQSLVPHVLTCIYESSLFGDTGLRHKIRQKCGLKITRLAVSCLNMQLVSNQIYFQAHAACFTKADDNSLYSPDKTVHLSSAKLTKIRGKNVLRCRQAAACSRWKAVKTGWRNSSITFKASRCYIDEQQVIML